MGCKLVSSLTEETKISWFINFVPLFFSRTTIHTCIGDWDKKRNKRKQTNEKLTISGKLRGQGKHKEPSGSCMLTS